MYINELIMRLTARNDANSEIYVAYETCLARLATGQGLAWTLRRMERDLLTLLGYGLMLDRECDSGRAVDPEADYAYHPDLGPRRWQIGMSGVRVRGSGLLALHADNAPGAADLGALKRLLRAVIAQHLGNFPLHAWGMLQNRSEGEQD
jgi:DNA repair protein RecO (recombination protein O)